MERKTTCKNSTVQIMIVRLQLNFGNFIGYACLSRDGHGSLFETQLTPTQNFCTQSNLTHESFYLTQLIPSSILGDLKKLFKNRYMSNENKI